jgi:hypothetical protein
VGGRAATYQRLHLDSVDAAVGHDCDLERNKAWTAVLDISALDISAEFRGVASLAGVVAWSVRRVSAVQGCEADQNDLKKQECGSSGGNGNSISM